MMHKSQFQKIYPYDWFCGPGSQMHFKVFRNQFEYLFENVLKFSRFIMKEFVGAAIIGYNMK